MAQQEVRKMCPGGDLDGFTRNSADYNMGLV
jgi:hypothetical protein